MMEVNTDIQTELTVLSDLTHRKCLNCKNVVEDNFCSVCGQNKSTHRYSLQHFFVHDLIHGVFHFDKGFFFTLKELFIRPGHSIREYVEGKRVQHFNYFSFALIILVIEYYLLGFYSVKSSDLYNDVDKIAGYHKVAKEYFKIVTLAGIPFLALTSYLIFIRGKQNYTEHLVLNIYRMSVVFIFNMLYIFVAIFYKNIQFLHILLITIPFIEMTYTSWFFIQYFSVFGYNKWSLIFRSILTSVIFILINNTFMSYVVNQIGQYFFK